LKKFSEKTRAVFWGYTYFFNQFGKFLFASLIFKFDKDVKEGKIDITIFPIFTIIMVQNVFIIILLTLMSKRSMLKQRINHNIKDGGLYSKGNEDKKPFLLSDKDSHLKSKGNPISVTISSSKFDLSSFENEKKIIGCKSKNNNNFDYVSSSSIINKEFSVDKQSIKEGKGKEESGKADGGEIKIGNSNVNVTSSLLIGNFKEEYVLNNNNNKNNSNNINVNISNCNNSGENISLDDIQYKNKKNQRHQDKKKNDDLELEKLANKHQQPQPNNNSSNNKKNRINNNNNTNNNHKKLELSKIEYITSTLKAIFAPQIFYHQLSMIFINFSLGIQFFSLINIFPHLNYTYTYSVLTEEIFFSKLIHLILLFFFPLIFLVKKLTRKAILLFAFNSNFIINFLILVNCINSTAFVHIFRFVWNICYITINLYNCEAAPFKVRYLNTSIMNLFFKFSCMIEISIIEKLISVNLFLPVVFNLVILLMDNLLVSKLEYETHFKSLEEIKLELN